MKKQNLITFLLSISFAFSSIYIIFFILYYKTDIPIATLLPTFFIIFEEFKYIIPIFILFPITCIYIGKIVAEDTIECVKLRYVSEIKKQEQRMVDYIKLAKLLTKPNTHELISDYLKRLDKKYKL